MTPKLRKAMRFARVRTLQHNIAAAATHKANAHVQALEATIGKLASLRDGMRPHEGPTTGAFLASSGEIAMRLDDARAKVATNAAHARQRAAALQAAQLAARMKQECADRLTEKAAKGAEQDADRKQRRTAAPRKRSQE